MIGSQVGIGLEVEPPLGERVSRATMQVCWNGSCHTPKLTLVPSTTAAPKSSCCGASAAPTGGKHAFADVPKLPKRQVEVTVVLYDDAGKRLLDQQVRVTPKATYPNGKDCGEAGPQAQLVAADGKLRERR